MYIPFFFRLICDNAAFSVVQLQILFNLQNHANGFLGKTQKPMNLNTLNAVLQISGTELMYVFKRA